ncbi:hypothetical protein pEp_SNUABM10_00042 [Erwinia phage pEp_SNUABM_10]|uniref:Uncharacterized protein n=1 Tax=Erwinia phage pEp_SNUABM_09 TaxID=2601644 RepID=A0A5J6DA99_9CAUD|nr:hypothetical protein pEpSNUABM09_40 [Erwinia phage pEp_SNUABM_09]QOC57641.1 hypothetical protein pEp_SNUABM03_00039 [Erwinia phage pEp_SNUABM_03]QOC57746.1 hypothetical protein pEp_SNUABM10_00042 [Erwinia phage pEp_SNUABM_10]
MSIRLHHNKSNGIFTIRNKSRAIVSASEKHPVIPFIGDTVELSPLVHGVITRGLYLEAKTGSRPFVPVVVTRFPFVRLVIARVKEVFRGTK